MRLTDLHEVGFPKGVNASRLAELLRAKYPHYQWEHFRLLQGKFALQKRLENAVAALFPVSLYFLSSPLTQHLFPRIDKGLVHRGMKPNITCGRKEG